MPKRQNLRKRRSDDEEDEEADELLDVLADAAVPLARGGRDRKHGISILDSDKEESGQHERHRGQTLDNKAAASDVLSQRMEEFVGSELDKTFQPSHQQSAEDEFTDNRIREDDDAVPSHLETKPVQEVSVPGFNKAITKVALTKDASGTVPAEVAMKKTKRSEPDKSNAPWVDRTLFPNRFGRQRKT